MSMAAKDVRVYRTLTNGRVNEGLPRDGGRCKGGAFKKGKWDSCWLGVIKERLLRC